MVARGQWLRGVRRKRRSYTIAAVKSRWLGASAVQRWGASFVLGRYRKQSLAEALGDILRHRKPPVEHLPEARGMHADLRGELISDKLPPRNLGPQVAGAVPKRHKWSFHCCVGSGKHRMSYDMRRVHGTVPVRGLYGL